MMRSNKNKRKMRKNWSWMLAIKGQLAGCSVNSRIAAEEGRGKMRVR